MNPKNIKQESLSEIFYNPSKGLSSRRLLEEARKQGYKDDEIKHFLSKQEVTQLHKPKSSKIKYYPITGKAGTVQSDLTFYDQYKKSNRGYGILLTCIDINSRRAYVQPLKNKTQREIIDAFQTIIEEAKDYHPVLVVGTDQGSEYKEGFVNFLKKQGIDHYYSDAGSKTEMAMVERFNRTIREYIEIYDCLQYKQIY
eukprot:Lithocolla_globosa_v1_NODE_20_length_9637_cov_33.687643.p6 type:complete len:198 gc:universal NODE_20_length_9637_cov_33.687643:963-1556(+)